MRRDLHAKTPDWLSIGEAIKVDLEDQVVGNQAAFRPVSGDSQSTRDRVTIPGRGIEIKVDYPISWYRGSSLSPDGTKLIINSGTESKVYEISPDGSHRGIEMKLPHVTYDAGPKGFITGWSWADHQTLIGEAEIDNEKGEFIEKRIYVFHVDKSILSRLDLGSLNLPTTEGLTVSKVGLDLDRLILSVGNYEFTVKADLKTPPKLTQGILPMVAARKVQYAADPVAESKLRDDPPFRFSGDGTSGKVVSRSGQILMESGEQIGIYGVEVGPDRIQVLVKGGNGVNLVINSATGDQVQLPSSPPGANMLGFGSWYWIGNQKLLGVSGIQAHDAKVASLAHCDEPHASQSKLYVYDLIAKQLSEVALPAFEEVPVFAVTEVSHDGFVHLFADAPVDGDSQDLGWFQMN